MLQAKARWNIGAADGNAAERLAEELHLPPIISRLLVVRGITDSAQAAHFLNGGTDQTYDPFLLDGMEQAVERIRKAIDNGEYIRIYGDYDADGVSSTTLMVHLLRQLGCTFDYYIPHRVHEGYGLNTAALDAAKEQGVGLIVTVDTGISAVKEIAHANALGIDVIVTDHHEPPEVLPDAYVLINPKKPGCPYPYKQLAGVGVALKLAQALLGRWPEELLEFAAIGTVADLMLLTDENRIIVKQGLERMRSTSNYGIRSLLEIAGVPVREVTSTHIGFALAPRINASGRLLSADTAVRLLTTTSEQEADQLAFELDQLNKERQRIVDEMAKQAVDMVEKRKADVGLPDAIVLAHEEWNVGVIGIVASKIVDRFYRPTIILGIDPETGMAKGSARSIAGFDMYRALTHCSDLMDHYGGHPMAAGMTLARAHLPELGLRLEQLAKEWLTPDDYIPQLDADLVCDFSDVTLESIGQLERLGPFGMGNPSPRFVFGDLALNDMRTMGKEQQHLKLSLRSAQDETAAAMDGVGFGKASLAEWISPSAQLEVLGELSINEWNGVRRPQIMIQDVRVPEIQLFDWRGAPKPEKKLAELCERLERHHSGQHDCSPAVIVFGEAVPAPLQSPSAQYTLWCADIHGRFRPANERAGLTPLSEASDVFIYSLPQRMEQLHALAAEASSAQRYYAAFGGTEEDKQGSIMPGREMFKAVYGAVMALRPEAANRSGGGQIVQAIARRCALSPHLVLFILDVFTEIGLIELEGEGYRVVPSSEKKDLSASLLYRSRSKRPDVEQELLYCSAKELRLKLLRGPEPNHSTMEEIV
ncbi:single-stranded-DNA-specific exonuclease RecJ [Paenibacillus elgii]|uniref:single-stranded-DNA-specific exonuclease RecJ n=1 Tax=Paenibacillus elgii TaxID=189691 RepID=UPI00203FAC1C|nr:single-stranded-DNA-specific exonuclease RecJ [Paenibacillus elgii]MCM3272882.1 single-stranded-DNA-specific exonuclease RecJ [Paenibacillus elgii]